MYLDNPEKRKAHAQKVIVADEKDQIIRSAHVDQSGTHFGQLKTET